MGMVIPRFIRNGLRAGIFHRYLMISPPAEVSVLICFTVARHVPCNGAGHGLHSYWGSASDEAHCLFYLPRFSFTVDPLLPPQVGY
jgi:hypothetical protein